MASTLFAVGHLIEALRRRHAGVGGVLSYLDEVQQDVVENVEAIVGLECGAAANPAP